MGKVLSKSKWILPVIVILLVFVAGVGILVAFLCGIAFAGLIWWVTRSVKPEGDLPSGSVSCCHYLGDDSDGSS